MVAPRSQFRVCTLNERSLRDICFCLFSSAKQQQQQVQADGAAAVTPVGHVRTLPVGEHPERVWHYDEEFQSGGDSPKPASSASQEQGEGAASSGGFVALNLSSGRQDFDLKEWVMVERPGSSRGAKATSSPSEEEEEVLHPGEGSPGWDKGNSSPTGAKAKHESGASSSRGSHRVDKLELSVGPPGVLPPVTPTSPAEALAEGILTQVRAPTRAERHAVTYIALHDSDCIQRFFTQLKKAAQSSSR